MQQEGSQGWEFRGLVFPHGCDIEEDGDMGDTTQDVSPPSLHQDNEGPPALFGISGIEQGRHFGEGRNCNASMFCQLSGCVRQDAWLRAEDAVQLEMNSVRNGFQGWRLGMS